MSLGQIIALIKAFGGGGGGGGSSLPTDPASDGTYVLENTVSSGTGTLSWGSGGGGGGGILIVHDTEGTLDKTYAEIKAALAAVIVTATNDLWYPVKYDEDSGYMVTVMGQGFGGSLTVNDYVADTADDYPVLD